MFAPIQAYLRKAASRDRLTAQIGPFLATFSPGTDNPYLNYAIPEDSASPSSADVEALTAAYHQRERKPRLEYIADLAPKAEAMLIAGGFTVEGRLPLMVYSSNAPQDFHVPPQIELITPQSDQEILDMVAAQQEAYGGDDSAPSPDVVAGWRKFAAAGGIAVCAREIATGITAGAGVCDAPFDHTTELAGIGVRPAYRRQGIARAMTAWLVRQALAAGTTNVFLMAAGEAEARIYQRAGFEQVGQVLHISRP